jgi:spermidine synthase
MRRSDLVFFASGLAALVYQTVWARLLSRLCGSDAAGVALVLAVFMGGLALGSALGARLARTTRRPVRLFVIVELALALWAGLSPELLTSIPPVGSALARAGVATLALSGPTILMGLTFPLMGRLTIDEPGDLARQTSAFYGANTLGAALGALAGPFVLMPIFGLAGALRCAALIEVLAAGLAWAWLRDGGLRGANRATRATSGLWREPLAWGAGLLGASALALEVLLTRLLVSMLGASIHAFGIVLAVFLTGIGLGSRWIDSELAGKDPDGHRRLFGWCALAVAPLTLAALALLGWQSGEADLFGGISNRMPIGTSLHRLWLGQAALAAVALLPPALVLGRALPSAAAGALVRRPELSPEQALGGIYAANTLGALVGALLAAFVLLPWLGLRGGLVAGLVLALAAAACARPRTQPWLACLGACLVLGAAVLEPAPPPEGIERLWIAHGPHATVSVEQAGDVRSLRVNGKVVATSAPVDLRLQRLLAHVPGLLHGNVKTAVCVGMGTGTTAGALLDFPKLEALTVVEISPVMPRAAAYFERWNGGLLEDARTRVVVADGRHTLARGEESWDLVTADPIHPWTAGSSDLYALEHFKAMHGRLTPGGVASQWLPLYQLSERDVKTVIATWCAAFEHTSAWLTAYDLVLVGAATPLAGPEELAKRPFPPRVAAALAGAGVRSPLELAALCIAEDSELRAYCAGTPPMEDDRPVLEFRAPRSFLSGYSVEALEWAGRDEFVLRLPAAAQARARQVRAALGRFLEALPQGWTEAARAYGEELLELPPL